jgi:hypothetical protein
MGSSRKFKRWSVASQTGLPGKGGDLGGPVHRERVVRWLRPKNNFLKYLMIAFEYRKKPMLASGWKYFASEN